MSRVLRSLRMVGSIVGTIAVEAALVVALVGLGRRPGFAIPIAHPVPWLRDGDPATVTVAVLRWCALAGAVWLLVSTALYAIAALSGIPAAIRAVRWSTLPAVRRAVDAACAVSVATTVVLAPAAAGAVRERGRSRASSGDPPSVSIVRDGHGGGSLARLPATPTAPAAPVTRPPVTESTLPPPAAPASTAAPAAPAPPSGVVLALAGDVAVVEGDNLWTIAAARLASATGRSPEVVGAAEIAPYWVQVCDTNRTRLASGDPDLVYPGEHVVLPPVMPR